eukprot:RCo013603
MGSVCSKPMSSDRVYATTAPPPAHTSASLVESAGSGVERLEDAPPHLAQAQAPVPTTIEATPLVDQSEDLSETDEEKEIRVAIEKGSAAEFGAVLSRRQPSGEQLREEPFCSMMYRATRAGHVEVMQKVYEWCGEHCLYWTDPGTGSTALHTAADRGHPEALLWLLERCGSRSHRSFDVQKLRNKFGESPVDLCQRGSKDDSQHLRCREVMEAYLGCELSLREGSEERG